MKAKADEYIRDRLNEWNINHFIDKLDAFDESMLLDLMNGFYIYKLSEINKLDIEEYFDKNTKWPERTAIPYEEAYDYRVRKSFFIAGAEWIIDKLREGYIKS